ncbi:CRISP/Allergen/PR-1-like [Anthonomus grandis grandis]|uniref:CRISP/Allergen/PR-1-like n=1 Tax=Anthonomus grandis grandis TaxID=2921223 RepID=UPI002165A81E|nr:CRISP/Allergen/PR-1-like [Anthonomus grandis grandis]
MIGRTVIVLFLCYYWHIVLASQCGKIHVNKLSAEEAKEIVDKHNELRRLIATGKTPNQPRGVNLRKMKYDDRLAHEAQKIADSCVFAHKKVLDSRWDNVGQNLFMSLSTDPSNGSSWKGAIQEWFDEHKNYKYKEVEKKDVGRKPDILHYTQVIWAENEYIGCGYTYFQTDEAFGFKKLYVCNYAQGNVVGQYPYKRGESGCENLC